MFVWYVNCILELNLIHSKILDYMKKLFFLSLLTCLTIISYAQDKIYKGTKVSILEIAKTDTYYEERTEFLGKDATALGDLTKNASGFYSGTLEVEGGRTCFFKSVRVSKVAEPVKKTTVDSKSAFTGTIPKGTAFKIIEVSVDDSYYSDRADIEGKTGTTTSEMTVDDDGYTSGSISTSDGKSYYFYKVKLGKNTSGTSSTTSTKTTPKTTTPAKPVKFVTGTILKGTSVYVAEISTDDSYYSDRFDIVGKKGKVKENMTMKEDGYYAGDFTYDDGSTAYFYKVKFSKTPVDKLIPTEKDKVKSSNDDDDWGDYYGESSNSSSTSKSDKSSEWSSAKNDADIKDGDKVEITSVNTEDSYYDNKDEYIGKQGIAKDITYDDERNGYGGTVELEDGGSPYFYLVKLKKIKSGSSSNSSSSSSASSIAKNTKVVVTDVGSGDSFYSNKSNYIGKTGKVAEGLTLQNDDLYSGKIIFNDGTDAYFFNVKVTILK